MTRIRVGFTLIELLIVMSIMAVLIGLFITLVGPLRLKAKLADTRVRMEAVKMGVATLGQQEGSATYVMQRMTERVPSATSDPEPGLGGVNTFGKLQPVTVNGVSMNLPTIAKRPAPRSSDPDGDWGYRGRGHLAFPWGKKFPLATSGASTAIASTMIGPEKFRLRDMSPFNTRKVLKLAGILPTRTGEPNYGYEQYITNRKESETWNDRWGHPLVVGAVLYQPTHQNSSNLPDGLRDGAWPAGGGPSIVRPSSYMPSGADESRKALLDHLKYYQYNRSVYIAVAAVGPSARVSATQLKSSTVTDWANSPTNPENGILQDLWDQANWVCQQAKVEPYDRDWTELSMDNPAWQGIRDDYKNSKKHALDMNNALDTTYAGKDEHCLLSAPTEFK
jgi:prepilin-type N-terminal cleavage/methylation domain-containing protein